MNYLFAANFVVLLILGSTLLLVWRRYPEQGFVRDLGYSSIAASFVPVGYMLYRQALPGLGAFGFGVFALGAIANLLFLVAAVTRLAGREFKRRLVLSLTLVLMLVLILPSFSSHLLYWPLTTFVITCVVGLMASKWLWNQSMAERMVGPLLVLLGANQLILIFWGEAGLQAATLFSIFLRLLIALAFIFAALDRSALALRALSARFELLTENSHQGVVVIDDQQILYANPAAQTIYGFANLAQLKTAFLQTQASSFKRDLVLGYHRQLQQGQIQTANWDGPRTRADGSALQLRFTAWRIDWEGRTATQILISDETERVNATRDLLYQATHDELTALPNRYMLLQCLKERCAAQEPAHPCLVLVLNINRFKLFNQSRGHLMGDHVLKAFAEKLHSCLSSETEIFRLGGDEFAAVFVDEHNARDSAARLQEMCRLPFTLQQEEFFIDVSMGMATYPENAVNADTLLRAANAAMHQAKKTPGTFMVMAERRFEQRSNRAFDHEQALRKAIKNQEIYLQFQPKVDAGSGRLLGFEALARWERPGIGHVSPVEFIAIAERTGLIVELGTSLLLQACSQIAAWRSQRYHCVAVAVNVSPLQLLNPMFPKLVEDALLEFELPANLLTLEITESAAITNLEQTQKQLQRLDDLGVKLAMDDFGTGFSSLSMLRDLPLHTLKIDRALIDPLPAPDALAIVTAICQVAVALNLRVVAEGVETLAHAEAALQAGCHELQGYYFSKPLRHEDAELWLKSL